jgi:voltage-gated potassium channel
MRSDRLYTFLKANPLVIQVILVLLVIILGGIFVYLVEQKQQGATITKLGDALWWAVVTITTVGYGEYYPVTSAGRIIAILVMFSGIGLVVALVSTLSQRRLQDIESMLKSKTGVRPGLFGDETKIAIKDKIDGIERLTEEDFDALIIMIKSLRHTLLEESKILYKCSSCGKAYYSKPKFCSDCGLELT